MKKKLISAAFVVAIALAAGYNVYNLQNKEALSDLALDNVEALANEESGTGFYYRHTAKCPMPIEYKTSVSCTLGGNEECFPSDC